MEFKYLILFILSILFQQNRCVYSVEEKTNNESTSGKSLLQIAGSCIRASDKILCLKERALEVLDEAIDSDKAFEVFDYLSMVKRDDYEKRDGRKDEEKLPNDPEEKNDKLNELILERVDEFINSRTWQLNIDDELLETEGRKGGGGFGGGGGKGGKKGKKGMGGALIMGGMMMAMMYKMAMAKIAAIAGAALIAAKIALVISLIISLKKLSGGGGGASEKTIVYASDGGGHEGGGYGGGGGGGHGGWQRSFAASKLAYRGYPQPEQPVYSQQEQSVYSQADSTGVNDNISATSDNQQYLSTPSTNVVGEDSSTNLGKTNEYFQDEHWKGY